MERPNRFHEQQERSGRSEAGRGQTVSQSSSSKTSRTDWLRLKATQDTDITLSDEHPAAKVQHIVRGIARQGLPPVSPKTLISLRVDADVLAWLKAQGAGYQTRDERCVRGLQRKPPARAPSDCNMLIRWNILLIPQLIRSDRRPIFMTTALLHSQ